MIYRLSVTLTDSEGVVEAFAMLSTNRTALEGAAIAFANGLVIGSAPIVTAQGCLRARMNLGTWPSPTIPELILDWIKEGDEGIKCCIGEVN